jgi:Mg2+/Co2+ transporter CorB
MLPALLLIALCLVLAMFFAAAETAITAFSRARIHHLAKEGNKRAARLSALESRREQLISALMIGNNTVNILAASLTTALALRCWGEEGVAYATLILTLIVVIFGEVLPKTYAIHHAESLALRWAGGLAFFLRLTSPLTAFLHGLVHLLKLDAGKDETLASASDLLRGTIDLHHQDGGMVKQDRDTLHSILDMGNIPVSDIMAHRMSMETLDISRPVPEIVSAATASEHSRIPLWEGNPDNIIGVLHVKTLVMHLRHSKAPLDAAALKNILVSPWFIPETMTIKNQLHAFRARKQHLALVIDEYGALKGLVTLEDIIEEIVGNISDEHDREQASDITQTAQGVYLIRGEATIRDVNRELGWSLPDEEASTLAGLVIHEAGLIPEIGQVFTFHFMHFTILERRNNRIVRLRVEPVSADDGQG